MSETLTLVLLFLVPGVIITAFLFFAYYKLRPTPRGRQVFLMHGIVIIPIYLMVNLPKVAFDINLDTIFVIVGNSLILIYAFVLMKFGESYERKRRKEL